MAVAHPVAPASDTPDEETLLFEAMILREVTGAVADALESLVRTVLVAFAGSRAGAGGELTEEQGAAVGAALASRIAAFAWEPMRRPLANAALRGHALGVRRAAARFVLPEDRDRARMIRPPRRIPVPNPDAALRKLLAEARSLASQGIRTESDAARVAAKVKAGKARIQGHARFVANEGINLGTAAVARRMGLRLLWVAERNACLHCLAHAGWVVEPGDLFPPVSFDPFAKGVLSVATCPLHPGCRCQLQTTDEPAGAPPADRSRVSPAARLAAEARRSVVYQWTDHASGPAMERAAEALLSAGAGLPASVEDRAWRTLRRQKKRGG